MTYGMNLILVGIGESAVTAYGLYYKIWQFILFAAFGMRDAIMPITAHAYGMGSLQRIQSSVKLGQLFTLVLMLAGTLGLEIFAEPFSAVFGLSGVTNELCVSAMHIISLCFIHLSSLCMIFTHSPAQIIGELFRTADRVLPVRHSLDFPQLYAGNMPFHIADVELSLDRKSVV